MRLVRSILILLLALLLTACGGVLSVDIDRPDPAQSTVQVLQTQVATLLPAGARLSMQSDSETIRRALLDSHREWSRLWVSGTVTQSTGGGQDAQPVSFQAWIDQPNARFRLLQGPAGSDPQTVQISDGSSVTRVSLPASETTTLPLPEPARQPYNPPFEVSDSIELHPLIGQMDTVARPVFYPGELALRGGQFRPVELTELAGRTALLVEWLQGNQALDRLWVDVETGGLLRWQAPIKGQEQLLMEVTVEKVRYDPPFDAGLFDSSFSQPPQYVSDVDALATDQGEPAVSSFPKGEGQLYFVAYGPTSGLNLLRLPTSCIAGRVPCDAPARVPGYPNVGSSIEPVSWSPDSTTGAVLIYDQVDGTNVLWLYRPADDIWTPLARFPVLYGPVVWSPDSRFVSFSAKTDPAGVEALFAVSIDGERTYDMTADIFGQENTRLAPVAWLDNETVLFQYVNQTTVELYTAAPKQLPKRLNDLTIERGVVALSPDRTRLAWSTQNAAGSSELWLAGLDGANARMLYSIQNTSIQQIEWSPRGDVLAFLTLSTSGSATNAAVYAYGLEGSEMYEGLRQLHQSPSLARLAFVPDAELLVVEDNQLGKLMVLPLRDAPATLLRAPGLLLDDQLLGISWRTGNEE